MMIYSISLGNTSTIYSDLSEQIGDKRQGKRELEREHKKERER